MATLQNALGAQYTLERELGRGGMATVYLARDVRHRRLVAIKVLHPDLSAVLGPDRFLREIELTASLQHPHILPLFDSGSVATEDPERRDSPALLYYVMPFVEGETLRARLDRERQLPVEDAVRLARETASALAYAHARGVVHRDVKPENVLLQGGHALVADFGIALAVQQAGGARMTQTGLSLGTPQYMAPEQAMGERGVDHRADVYALGAVLYEMLAGEPPFTGPTSQAIMARLLTEPPRSLVAQRPSVPSHVDVAVRRALEKLPADRFAGVDAFAAALAAPLIPPPALQAQPVQRPADERPSAGIDARRSRARSVGQVAALGVAALAVGAAAGWALRSTPARAGVAGEPIRFTMEPDSGTLALANPAISPDGRTIVFAVVGPNGTRLYARRVDALAARPLAGTEDAESAFFSPDGAWIAFYSNGALHKARLDGGNPVPVADLPALTVFCGGTWSSDDTILYINQRGELYRVSAAGGSVTRVRLADSTLHVWGAHALPGGRSLLVNVGESSDPGRIGLLDLGSGQVEEFGPGMGVRYVPGYLLYANEDGQLFRRPFDIDRLRPAGDREQIANNVAFAEGRLGRVGLGFAGLFPSFDAAPTGALVYRVAANPSVVSQRLRVFDRAGREEHGVAARSPWAPRFSHDGRVAYGAYAPTSARADARDLWIADLAAGRTQRVTIDARDNNDPHWSHDGQALAYSRLALDTGSRKELRVQRLDSRTSRPATVRPPSLRVGTEWPSDWSRDGRVIFFTNVTPDGEMDIWLQPLAPDTARPYLATAEREFGARLSPDGQLVAYTSNETGNPEVYVRPYPGPGPKLPVSVGGGNGPVWRGDGKALFFWQNSQMFEVERRDAGSGLTFGRQTRLFSAPYIENYHPNYDVSPDGTRFVVVTGPVVPNQLVVELNVLGAATTPDRVQR